MSPFSTLSDDDGLTDVLKAFPRTSDKLLRLVEGVMSSPGELSRGEREAIAAAVSRHNDVGYCVFYHTLFSEVFSGPIEATNQRLAPLLTYARHLCVGTRVELGVAFLAAREAGWSERAIYEVVEVCGLFNYVNTIVRAAGLKAPRSRPAPLPTREDLRGSYRAMADAIGTE